MREEVKRGFFELFVMVDQNLLQVNMTNVWGPNDTVSDLQHVCGTNKSYHMTSNIITVLYHCLVKGGQGFGCVVEGMGCGAKRHF